MLDLDTDRFLLPSRTAEAAAELRDWSDGESLEALLERLAAADFVIGLVVYSVSLAVQPAWLAPVAVDIE